MAMAVFSLGEDLSTLAPGLSQCYWQLRFCDLQILVAGQPGSPVKCHRLILAQVSKYLHSYVLSRRNGEMTMLVLAGADNPIRLAKDVEHFMDNLYMCLSTTMDLEIDVFLYIYLCR